MLTVTTQPIGTSNTERQATVDYLIKSLTDLFPTNGVRVVARAILGEENIYVRYTHNRDASTCNSKIIENDPAYMGFCIGKERNGTWVIEYPSTHCNRLMGRDRPLNFRKLRADTEQKVAEKLVAWFTKHKDLIGTAGNIPL